MANSSSPSRAAYDGKCEISLSLTPNNGHLGSEIAIQISPIQIPLPGWLKGGGSKDASLGTSPKTSTELRSSGKPPRPRIPHLLLKHKLPFPSQQSRPRLNSKSGNFSQQGNDPIQKNQHSAVTSQWA